MQPLANGKIMFDDVFEMNYYLFNEIGLSINRNQYLYDQETGIEIKYKDKYIKATVQPVDIYSGRNDIIFEPSRNYNMMVTLLGYYLDKESQSEDGDRIGYIAQCVEDDGTREKQRVIIKTRNGDYISQFYKNVYLGYIECIFALSGNFIVDLSNFDFEIVL